MASTSALPNAFPQMCWKTCFPSAWLDRLGLLCCLLLPWLLIVSRGGSDGVGVCLSVLFIAHSVRAKDWAWTRDPVVRVCAVAWAWMLLIATPFAYDAHESLKVALPWIRWVLLYAAIVHWVLRPGKHLRLAALNLAVMLALVIIDTVWQYHFGISLTGHRPNLDYRLTGPMDNVKVGIFISKLCFATGAILLFSALQQHRRKAAWGAIILLAACIATVVLSGERTATFTCFLGFSLVSATLCLTEPALRVKTMLGFAAVLVLCLALLFTQEVLQDRLVWLHINIAAFSTSSYGLLDLAGIHMGAAHLATGAGLKGFRELCPQFINPDFPSLCNLHPHNPYVEWFAELGLPGLLLFCAIVVSLLWHVLRAVMRQRGAGRVLAAMVFAVIVMNFFPLMATQSFFSNWPALLLWYSISTAMASLNMVNAYEKD